MRNIVWNQWRNKVGDQWLLFSKMGKMFIFSPLCVMKTSRNKYNLFSQEMQILLVARKTISKSWTVKKAEHRRIDAFELWCCRRLLRVPWNARKSNQSILKEIIPGCSLEGLMLKLKLQYFGHLMWRADSLEKTVARSQCEEFHPWQGHAAEL